MIDLVALHVLAVDLNDPSLLQDPTLSNMRDKAMECGRSFVSLLLCARGFSVVTQLTRFEAVARRRCMPSNFVAEEKLFPFSAQVSKEIRSVMLARATIMSCQQWLFFCCMEKTRAYRSMQNKWWQEGNEGKKLGPLVEMAMEQRVQHMRIGWTQEGSLMSSGVVWNHRDNNIVVLGPNASPVLSGETELEIKFRSSPQVEKCVSHAMTSGDLLVICYEGVKHPEESVCRDHSYQAWSMSSGELVEERAEEGNVMYAHVHGKLFVRMTDRPKDYRPPGSLEISTRLLGTDHKSITRFVRHIGSPSASHQGGAPSFCAKTGNFAKMHTIHEPLAVDGVVGTRRAAQLDYYEVQDNGSGVISFDVFNVAKYHVCTCHVDSVLLSPTGNVMAVFRRGIQSEGKLYLYEKIAESSFNSESQTMEPRSNWAVRKVAALAQLYPPYPTLLSFDLEDDGETREFFSPCGSMLITMINGRVGEGVLVVNVRESLRWSRGGIVSNFYAVGPNSIPRGVVWHDEGMWFQARSHGGILHIGLHAAQA